MFHGPLVKKVSSIVSEISGNILEEKQIPMVENRLKKRMMDLGISGSDEYIQYIDENRQTEVKLLVSLLTTHHTFFFREFIHFEKLEEFLPQIVEAVKSQGRNKIKLWSAACSKGQEVYSLAMFLDFHLKKFPSIGYEILGTDIDHQSISIAKNAVYHRREIKEIPLNYMSNHWARGTGDISDFVKVKKSLTENCRFGEANLMDFSPVIGSEKFDLIFCRNVFIYFKEEQIEKISREMKKTLYPEGMMILGVSEPLRNQDLNLLNIGPSMYLNGVKKKIKEEIPLKVKKSKIRVLAVDDSKSILKLLERIFQTDPEIELVATAGNGIEAAEVSKKVEFDLMTLDIHMPEMNGIEYLRRYFNSSHPPVVMISSASRDDSQNALESMRFGASDFVEKPALNNLHQKGEEICTKIKSAFHYGQNIKSIEKKTHSVDFEFTRKVVIQHPEENQRLIFSHLVDKRKVWASLKEMGPELPPSYVFFEGHENLIESLVTEWRSELFRYQVKYLENDFECEKGHIYLLDSNNFSKIYEKGKGKKQSLEIYGKVGQRLVSQISRYNDLYILLEDTFEKDSKLERIASDIIPSTSFSVLLSYYYEEKKAA